MTETRQHLVVLISQTAQGSSILPLFGNWRPVINLQSGKFCFVFCFFAHLLSTTALRQTHDAP